MVTFMDMKINELDIVKLANGREATVLEIYDDGKAFCVEAASSIAGEYNLFEITHRRYCVCHLALPTWLSENAQIKRLLRKLSQQ